MMIWIFKYGEYLKEKKRRISELLELSRKPFIYLSALSSAESRNMLSLVYIERIGQARELVKI